MTPGISVLGMLVFKILAFEILGCEIRAFEIADCDLVALIIMAPGLIVHRSCQRISVCSGALFLSPLQGFRDVINESLAIAGREAFNQGGAEFPEGFLVLRIDGQVVQFVRVTFGVVQFLDAVGVTVADVLSL